jgi:hypothetical protein
LPTPENIGPSEKLLFLNGLRLLHHGVRPMEIVQKKLSHKHTFTFEEASFNFSFEDKTGSDDVDIAYTHFPQKSSVTIEQNYWLRNVGILWCIVGTMQLGLSLGAEGPLAVKSFWLMLGILCLIWFRYSKVVYSVFKAEAGHVFVIQGDEHDRIIHEIHSRRKKQLFDWYGEINIETDLDSEIEKFKWLSSEKVLTDEQAQQKISEAEYVYCEKVDIPQEQLN